MHTSTRKKTVTRQTRPSDAALHGETHSGRTRPEPLITHLLDTVGNRAARRWLLRTAASPDSPPLDATACLARDAGHLAAPRDAHGKGPPDLPVSDPGDRCEREAERIAEQVMRMAAPSPASPPTAASSESTGGRMPDGARASASVVAGVLSSGHPLDASARTFMESRFGHDFSRVRVHTDAMARASALAYQARAYTIGNHIVFGADQYAPASETGRNLLAHELTHVLQQQGPGGPSRPAGSGPAIREKSDGSPIIRRRIMLRGPPPRHAMNAQERRRLLAPGPSHRDAQIIVRHGALAGRIVDDMVASGDDLEFSDLHQLQSELIKRLTTSTVMTATQEGGSEWPAFGYPRRGQVRNYGPRVNFAARDYWEPEVPDGWDNRAYRVRSTSARHAGDPPDSGYSFTLKPNRRHQGYQALMNLFVRQAGELRRNRTLIHCDHLASLIHYRSFAAALGEQEFNRRVSTLRNPANPADGYIIPLELRWNGFMDLGEGAAAPGARHLQRVGQGRGRIPRLNREDLVIGDHVVFFNHIFYDFLLSIAGRTGNWRMENAILVDRRGPAGGVQQDFFQGHGSGRNTERAMMLELIQRFNDVVPDATDALRADFPAQQSRFPNVLQRTGGNFAIRGSAVSGSGLPAPVVSTAISPSITLPPETNWRIRRLGPSDLDEIPGLYHPRVYSMIGGRPVYRDPARRLWPALRPVESQ